MDEPTNEQDPVNVNEVLRSDETSQSLRDLIAVMGWQSLGIPDKTDQDFIDLAEQVSPGGSASLMKDEVDPRWVHVMEGVRNLRNAVDIAAGRRTTTEAAQTTLSHANGEFFAGITDMYPIQTIDEAVRLRSLSPEELVAEIARIHQRQIAFSVGQKESAGSDPLARDIANTSHAIWALRTEGLKMGLQSVGLSLDSNGSVVPGGPRLSQDQQREAVSLLHDNLSEVMNITYGKENFDE